MNQFETKSEEICIAVVVTYNRPNLLLKVIDSLKNQSVSLDKIIIIDNCCDIHVKDIVQTSSLVNVYRSSKNEGGAGGFTKGISIAREAKADWIWTMDDDASPDSNALKELLKAKKSIKNKSKIGALCCSVYEMGEYAYFHQKKYNFKFGIEKFVKLNPNQLNSNNCFDIDITSFVGLFISSKAIKKIGLPTKEFFISHDDMEYSLRLKSKNFSIFLVPSSRIWHDVEGKSRLANDFSPRHYYNIRNHIFVTRKYTTQKIISVPLSIFRSLKILKISKIKNFKKNIYLFLKSIKDGLYTDLSKLN